MINLKLILCVLLAYGSVFGMEQTIALSKARVRLDLMTKNFGCSIQGRNYRGIPFLCYMLLDNRTIDKLLLQEFVKRGGDINQSFVTEDPHDVTFGYPGATPLHIACRNGNSQLIKDLIECGADPKITNKKGETCLHWLCASNVYFPENEETTNLIALLVERGVPLNAKSNSDGKTAIMIAIDQDRIFVYKQLIPYGAGKSDEVVDYALGKALGTSDTKVQSFYVNLWFDHKRKPYLYTVLWVLKQYRVFGDLRRFMLRYMPTLLPYHSLPKIYSTQQELVQVYAQRDAERLDLMTYLNKK